MDTSLLWFGFDNRRARSAKEITRKPYNLKMTLKKIVFDERWRIVL